MRSLISLISRNRHCYPFDRHRSRRYCAMDIAFIIIYMREMCITDEMTKQSHVGLQLCARVMYSQVIVPSRCITDLAMRNAHISLFGKSLFASDARVSREPHDKTNLPHRPIRPEATVSKVNGKRNVNGTRYADMHGTGWQRIGMKRDDPRLRVCGSGVKRPALAFAFHFHSSPARAHRFDFVARDWIPLWNLRECSSVMLLDHIRLVAVETPRLKSR